MGEPVLAPNVFQHSSRAVTPFLLYQIRLEWQEEIKRRGLFQLSILTASFDPLTYLKKWDSSSSPPLD